MNSLLLSRIAKDYLNQDPDFVPPKQLYRLGWGRSTLGPHPRSRQRDRRPMSLETLAAVLSALREKASSFFDSEESDAAVMLSTSPRLAKPRHLPPGSYNPPRYFSKGALDLDKKKNPAPIPYLLTETHEMDKSRPVPNNSLLLRSLCKGKGTLRQNKQGLFYLDIDNRFISSMVPYLKAFGLVKPPYFNLFGAPDGAHIPVIPSREAAFQYIDQVAEIGKEFSFEIEGLYSIEPEIWPEVEQVWFFKLKSPELEKLRRRYFLPSVPNGHSFHIAVAVKPRATLSHQSRPLPIMRINIGVLAA